MFILKNIWLIAPKIRRQKSIRFTQKPKTS
jgi:hypothetical protein